MVIPQFPTRLLKDSPIPGSNTAPATVASGGCARTSGAIGRSGTITGNVALGNGTHTVTLVNNSAITGNLSSGATGTAKLTVDHSKVSVAAGAPLHTSTATFSTGSSLTFRMTAPVALSAFGPLTLTYAVTGATRLVVKMNLGARGDGPAHWARRRLLAYPDLVMMHRQLTNLRTLAEASA